MSKDITERPILFSTQMVQAIMEGWKRQTRRVINPQPHALTEAMRDYPRTNRWWAASKMEYDNSVEYKNIGSDYQHDWKCPYGKPGDLLYVRETWCRMDGDYFYKSSVKYPDTLVWKPSILMPKEAARIFLKVKDIKVQRVQDISTKDIKREGLQIPTNDDRPLIPLTDKHFPHEYLKMAIQESRQFGEAELFRAFWIQLWDSINAKRGYGWESNPWVWVVEFEKMENNSKHN